MLSVAAAADGATHRPSAPPYPSVGGVERSKSPQAEASGSSTGGCIDSYGGMLARQNTHLCAYRLGFPLSAGQPTVVGHVYGLWVCYSHFENHQSIATIHHNVRL